VWEAPNREMATDWRVSRGGGGNDNGQKRTGDRGDPSVRGRWTESREDGGGSGVLERECEGAGRKGERDGGQWLLNALGHVTEGKEGCREGPGARGGREREERGGSGAAGDGSNRRHRPPSGGRGRRGTSDAGAMADKWGRATAGPGG
jgi:hypothetical protein